MTLPERRKKKKMTQEHVASVLGVDRTTISKWETGETFPSTEKLPKLAQLYNCTVDDLLKQESEVS